MQSSCDIDVIIIYLSEIKSGVALMYRAICLSIFLLFVFSSPLSAKGKLPPEPPRKNFPFRSEEHKGADSFEHGRPVVGTTYFYWYDIDSKSHIINRDGTDALTNHPADINNISYKRASWHSEQLKDMIAAGIDFLMPVFWGVPGKYDGWSFEGLPPLVEAHSALQKEGLQPPAIALFYDTSILRWNSFNEDGTSYHVDLKTEFGKDWFYTPIRDFFSIIPPSKWARVDGRPIVFLYAAAFAKKQDPKQFDYVRRRFGNDFDMEPFIVKSSQWEGQADATYSWGGAVSGPLIYREVVSLGPGYDHTAVPGRTPLVVERRDGQTYIECWLKVLQLNPDQRPWMMHIETWNEWHEGTDVAHSREYGRSYIVLTRLFADIWRTKTRLSLSAGYADAGSVVWALGRPKGLNLRQSSGDGVWQVKKFAEVESVVSEPNPHLSKSRYLYFNVDDAFAYELFGETVSVSVTYRDAGCSSFRLEYDNANPAKGLFEGAFRAVKGISVGRTGKWKTREFTLPQCRFMNRCNGTDFRIVIIGGDLSLAVSRVELVRMKKTKEN